MPKEINAVICAVNSKYIHSSLAPWYLKAASEKNCRQKVNVHVVEGTINEPPGKILSRIVELSPDVAGFSCYIWNIEIIKELIRKLRQQLPEVVIILGGPEVSYCAKDILTQLPEANYIISGEGELPFSLLLDAISAGSGVENIPGLCYRVVEDIIVSPPHTSKEEPPSPYMPEYFNALQGRIAYLETSRGCPYSCAFCLSGRCGNQRFFDTDRAKDEILRLAGSGAKTIKLVDRTFNSNKKRAEELFAFIIENYGHSIQRVCFHFEIAGDLLTESTLNILKHAPAGAIQFEIGLQSFNEETLKAINRRTDTQKLIKNIRQLISFNNIHIHIDLIAGLPKEDLQSFENSFNTAYNLAPHMLQLGFLKLLHGAPIRQRPELFPCTYSQKPPYEVLKTPWLSEADLALLKLVENALERLYNSGRFKNTLAYVLKSSGLSPFELFKEFGTYIANKGTAGVSLDTFTAYVFDYFSAKRYIDPVMLRDQMVIDRLALSPYIPPCLKVSDPNLKRAIKLLEKNPNLRKPEGVKRGYALLYSEPALIFADYTNPHPVTKHYEVKRYPLNLQ